MKITLAMLKKNGACADQAAEFARRFGDGVEVTESDCVSVASVFDWDWAAQHFLTAPARAAYDEATAAAGAAYDEATAAAWAAYSEARARAFARAAV